MATDPIEKQDIRHAVLKAVATQPRIAHTAEMVAARCRRWLPFAFTTDDIRDALTFLAGMGFISTMHDPFGAEPFYQITPAGTLAYERAESA